MRTPQASEGVLGSARPATNNEGGGARTSAVYGPGYGAFLKVLTIGAKRSDLKGMVLASDRVLSDNIGRPKENWRMVAVLTGKAVVITGSGSMAPPAGRRPRGAAVVVNDIERGRRTKP